jgi:hypothetical protein
MGYGFCTSASVKSVFLTGIGCADDIELPFRVAAKGSLDDNSSFRTQAAYTGSQKNPKTRIVGLERLQLERHGAEIQHRTCDQTLSDAPEPKWRYRAGGL